MDVEVESVDVIRIVLQFLKENKLQQSFRTLQNESQVSLNSMDNPNILISAIKQGKWDNVLELIQDLRLPYSKLSNLYEHIIFELLEMREIETVKVLIREGNADIPLDISDQGFSSILINMRKNEPNRFFRLEKLAHEPHFNRDQVYESGITKEKRRIQIAQDIIDELQTAPSSRLLSLISQSLRYQELKGALPEGQQYDLFRETSPDTLQPELYPTRMHGQIKFGKKSFPMCCLFSPDGKYLATGSVDGFIEIWNYATCKLKKELSYQSSDHFMIHQSSVLCLNFSVDGLLLVSGDRSGDIKIWEIKTGKCINKFTKAHQKAITSVKFSKKANKILSCSQDGTIRIHGRKSNKTLTSFRGHSSFVNDCNWINGEVNIISCSSDGTIKIWNTAQGDCIRTFRPGSDSYYEATINSIILHPTRENEIIICNRSSKLHLYSTEGKLLREFINPNNRDFVSCCVSFPDGLWLYGVTDDGLLQSFNIESGDLMNSLQVHDREITGITSHPHRNLIGTITEGVLLKLWKPSANQKVVLPKKSQTTSNGDKKSSSKIQFVIKK